MNDDDLEEFLEANFQQLEKDLYEQEVTEPTITYFRFGQESAVTTWTGLYKSHQS